MHTHRFILGLIIALSNTAVFANNTQRLELTVPRIAILSVESTPSLVFAEGDAPLVGSSSLSISSNDPQTKLQITPSGISLMIMSSSICPATNTTSTTTPIICEIGINRMQNNALTFEATRNGTDAPSIAYTLMQ